MLKKKKKIKYIVLKTIIIYGRLPFTLYVQNTH